MVVGGTSRAGKSREGWHHWARREHHGVKHVEARVHSLRHVARVHAWRAGLRAQRSRHVRVRPLRRIRHPRHHGVRAHHLGRWRCCQRSRVRRGRRGGRIVLGACLRRRSGLCDTVVGLDGAVRHNAVAEVKVHRLFGRELGGVRSGALKIAVQVRNRAMSHWGVEQTTSRGRGVAEYGRTRLARTSRREGVGGILSASAGRSPDSRRGDRVVVRRLLELKRTDSRATGQGLGVAGRTARRCGSAGCVNDPRLLSLDSDAVVINERFVLKSRR